MLSHSDIHTADHPSFYRLQILHGLRCGLFLLRPSSRDHLLDRLHWHNPISRSLLDLDTKQTSLIPAHGQFVTISTDAVYHDSL